MVPDDADDDKLVALALAARADVLVTSDRHLKNLPPIDGLLVLSPSETLRRFPQLDVGPDAVDP